MEININQNESLECGAYLLNHDRAPYRPYDKETSIYLTQEENTKLKEEILRLINNSSTVLKICSFIITDSEIFEALLNKAQNSKTAIFILTQLDPSKLIDSNSLLNYLTEEEVRESTTQIHLKFIKLLYDNGVHVRASLSAHAKFIICDREIGFIASANLTTPSLSQNTESGIYLDIKSAKALDNLFDVIFQMGTSYRQFLSSSKRNKMLVVQGEVSVDKNLLPRHTNSQLRYTYDHLTNNLYHEIISIVKSSNLFLFISTYSIVGLEKLPEFTTAIKDAVSRGVDVSIFCRGMNYRHDHLIGSQILHSCGARIYADIYNHSKGIVNESLGLMFTANIDGNHGLKDGFEVGYILNNEQRHDFMELHKYLINISYYKFSMKPERIKFFDTYLDYETKKGINAPSFPQNIIIRIKESLINQSKSIVQYPLFYGKAKSDEFIIAGSSYYTCSVFNDVIQIIDISKPRFDLERYSLKYINLKIVSS